MTGHREAENTAKQLRDVFGSRVHDDTAVPLGEIDYFRMQYTYQAKSSTNFLLNIIFRLNERIADLRKSIENNNIACISSSPKPVPDDSVNHPGYYKAHGKECIVEMFILFGLDSFVAFCQMNAWKYRYRAGRKVNEPFDNDNAKADRYIEYAARAKEISYWNLTPSRLTDDDFWDDFYNTTYHVKS